MGDPFISNYPPTSYASKHYVSSPQNRCVLQDKLGVIYVSNGDLVLSFNGKRWTAVEGTSNKAFYKLAKDLQGSIFTGGKSDLGFVSANLQGQPLFVSQLDKVPSPSRPFSMIFNVVSDQNGRIFFLDGARLIVWDGIRMRSWSDPSGFQRASVVNGVAYFNTKGNGLWTFDGNELVPVPHSNALSGITIRGLHPLKNGKANSLLVLSSEKGLFRFDGNRLDAIKSPADSLVLWSSIGLANGTIAMATDKGLGILDPIDFGVRKTDETSGLDCNALLYTSVDAEQGVWAASNNGISRIDNPATILKMNIVGRKSIMVHAMAKLGNELIVGMVDGCWRIKEMNGKLEMLKIPKMKDLGKAILPFQGGMLLFSAADGISWWKGEILKKVLDYNAVFMLRSSSDSSRFFVGMDKGIASIQFQNNRWVDEGKITGLDHPIYDIAETPNGDIWAGFTTISRIHYPDGFASQPIVTTFDSTQGFTEDHGEYDLFQYDGKLYFGTNRGIFRFDEARQHLVPDATFGERFADHGHAAYYMVEDLLGQIWLYDGERTGFLRKDKTGQWQWNDLPLRRMEDQEVWSIYPSPDSLIWIGTTTTLYCYDPRIPKDYHVPFHTLIDRVTVNDTSVVFYGNYADASGLLTDIQPDNYKLTFPFERNNIAFSYTATSYEYPEKTVFSHWLEGLEDDWSPWGPESDKAYNDLPEGTYTFHARSKNLYDTLGKEAAYTFTILPPWYRTWWAYLIYICAAIGSVVLLVRWQVGRANRKQERARDLERKQERAIMQATIDTQENERIRIARDLHDEVGAMLSTVKMSIKHSQRKLAKEGISSSLDESTGLLDAVIGSVREISHDLLPPSLESLGLADALSGLAEQTAHLSGIPFDCVVLGESYRMPIRKELAIYRVLQEMISNSLKHSQATQRTLRISFSAQQLKIVFEDNGLGFDYAEVIQKGTGLGLRGMQSRIEAMGGSLHLRTEPSEGFYAEIVLPTAPL